MEFVNLLRGAGDEDISTRGNMLFHELSAPTTKLILSISDDPSAAAVVVALGFAKSVVTVFSRFAGRHADIRGPKLNQLSCELTSTTRTWVALCRKDSEVARRFFHHTRQFSRRMEELMVRVDLLQQQLHRGWSPADKCKSWCFPAVWDGPSALKDLDDKLSVEMVKQLLREQTAAMEQLWETFPVISFANRPHYDEPDVRYFLASIPLRQTAQDFEGAEAWDDMCESLRFHFQLGQRSRRSAAVRSRSCGSRNPTTTSGMCATSWPPFLCGRQRRISKGLKHGMTCVRACLSISNWGKDRRAAQPPWHGGVAEAPCSHAHDLSFQPLLLVVCRAPTELGLTVSKALHLFGDDCAADVLFPCGEHTHALAIEGLCWRLSHLPPSALSAVTIPPQSCCRPSSKTASVTCWTNGPSRLHREMGTPQLPPACCWSWSNRASQVLHCLLRFRSPDLECELAQMQCEGMRALCARGASHVHLVHGPPLSRKLQGHTRALGSWKRIVLLADTTEFELYRQTRCVLQSPDVPGVVLDWGCSEPTRKAYRLSVCLFSLLAIGIVGQTLPVPCCMKAPRDYGQASKPLIIEIGDPSECPVLQLIGEQTRTGPADVQTPTQPVMRNLIGLAHRHPATVTHKAVVEAMVADLDAQGFIHRRDVERAPTEMQCHSCVHTPESLNKMAQVLAKVVGSQCGAKGCHDPSIIVLLGETGCGKTYLLQKLLELLGAGSWQTAAAKGDSGGTSTSTSQFSSTCTSQSSNS